MLQRAASNAYSWWWSSHIRTKQSKWLEQSLQDMEEKVQSMLKLIEEDGDSFRKRAEMYYKRRPELINFVQESFRGYRSLAERYDKISKELQNANNTIATVFPEQVQFAMEEEDDDDYDSPKTRKKVTIPQHLQPATAPNVPKVPTRDLKGILTNASKKLQAKKAPPKPTNPPVKSRPKSGLNKPEAVKEIDKLQKEILAMQTVKEFVKSSYESGLAKYWDIENKITEFQERVSGLQDEFGVVNVIEDDEARTLMVQTALRSCNETLTQLQEKQDKSSQVAKAEFKRVESAREKLMTLRNEFHLPDQKGDEKPTAKDETVKTEEDAKPEGESVSQEKQELDALREKIKEHFEVGIDESLTMTEIAERIDELVSKVISLETSVSSQTALIDRLKTDGEDLQAQIQNLEDDKANLIDDRNSLSNKIKDLEDKLSSLQILNHNVEDKNNDLSSHSIDRLKTDSEDLQSQIKNLEDDKANLIDDRNSLSNKIKDLEDKLNSLQVLNHNVEDKNNNRVGVSSHNEERSSVGDKTSKELGTSQEKPNPEVSSTVSGDSKDVASVDKPVVQDKKEDPKSPSKVEEVSSSRSVEVNEADKIDTQKDNKVGEEKCLDKVDQKEAVTGDQKDIEKESDSQLAANRSSEKSDSKVGEDNVNAKIQELGLDKEESPNWEKLLVNDLEDREKVILTEYTAILRNYKDVKKKLNDAESKNRDNLFAIAQRDQEISSLRHKLNLPHEDGNKDSQEENAKPANDEEVEKMIEMDQPQSVSPVEEKFRTSIDALLDENLEFWLRFSTSFHQIQKFKTGFQDLQDEVSKLKDKEKEKEKEKEKTNQEGSSVADIKSDIRPIYKHMSEIQAELAVWIEQSGLLKDELARRFSSLCGIEEDIINALEAGAETEEMKFTSHEAAKFRGEVLNMKQENKKVRKELMGGLDHITILQLEIEKTLAQLDEEYDISGSKNNKSQLRHSTSRSKIPLRSFIFGTKPKKKTSIFSCMHHRKYDIRSALPM